MPVFQNLQTGDVLNNIAITEADSLSLDGSFIDIGGVATSSIDVLGIPEAAIDVMPNLTINQNITLDGNAINGGNGIILGVIDDSLVTTDTTYSSSRIETRIDEEVGDEDFDFVLLFENRLSM